MKVYEREIKEWTKKLKEVKGIKKPEPIAKLLVLIENWSYGDAFAGLCLDKIMTSNINNLTKFYNKVMKENRKFIGKPDLLNLLKKFKELTKG